MKITRFYILWLCFAFASYAADDAVIMALKRAASSSDPHVRAAAARALGEFDGAMTRESLLTLVQDKNDIVRAAAAEALTKSSDPAATKIFLTLLDNESVRMATLATGMVFQSSSPLPKQFEEFVAEPGAVNAIEALSRTKNPAVTQPIIERGLMSPAIAVRIAAAVALGRLKDRTAVKPLIEILEAHYRTPTNDTGPVFPGHSPGTTRQLKENNAYLRSAVVWALGEIRAPAAKPVLQRALEDDNSLVRDAAKEALEKIE